MIVKKSLLLLSIWMLSIVACDKVELRPKSAAPGSEKIQSFEGAFVKDGKGGLFQNIKWYEYEMATHIIWSRQDVFAIRSAGQIFKLQVRAYYDQATNEPGLFRIALGQGAGAGREVMVDARACGNPFTNPDHAGCLQDPERNVFTYLKFSDLSTLRMTDHQAQNSLDWDIAFRGTDVKLNAGISGPRNVVGTLLKRFDFFTDTVGQVSAEKLRDLNLQTQAQAEFVNLRTADVEAFYLPDGVDRVMYEKDWFQADALTGLRTAKDHNLWILKSPIKDWLAEIRVAEIFETRIDATGEIQSAITFESRLQGPGETSFARATQRLTIQLSSSQRTMQFCVSLVRNESWACVKDRTDWDFRLLAVHQTKANVLNREWRIFVNQGGRGPLTN